MVSKLLHYIDVDIWRTPVKNLKGRKGFFIRLLRIIVLSYREFGSDQCSLRASALTFYSLLSIVPVFAMAFGIAKGFGVDKLLREKILENMQGQQEIMNYVLQFSENLLENTKGGIIAGIGLVLLFWAIIQVLSHIEKSFNAIWGIQNARGFGQKFTDYLSLMLIAPIFYVIASSATVFIASQIELITAKFAFLGPFGKVLPQLFKLLPIAVFSGLLTYLYIFIPNGKIQFKSALAGGIVAGITYQIVQWAYIYFQIGVSNAGAVYGTFAALPLFLIWLQTSWMIVLYGAEIAFAHQNETRYDYEQDCLNASYETKKVMALRITHLCVNRFIAGQPPFSSDEIAQEIESPIRLVREILELLTRAKILNVAGGTDERDLRYQPARDVNAMTIQFVIDRMEKAGTQDVPMAETPESKRLREALHFFDQKLRTLPENLLLKDLNRAK